MPTMMGLGFWKSCMLALNLGYQRDGEHDIPRFGALDEVIPVRPACLISIIVGVDDYRGAAEELLGW